MPRNDHARPPSPAGRLRSGLRRHGLARRPEAVRSLVRARALRFLDGNRIVPFNNGRDGLAAMLEAIDGAYHFVHI